MRLMPWRVRRSLQFAIDHPGWAGLVCGVVGTLVAGAAMEYAHVRLMLYLTPQPATPGVPNARAR